MSQVSFSSLVSRDVFQSGALSDTAKIDLRDYFVSVKGRYDSGDEFPYGIDELVPVVFASKQKATDALVKDFAQDIDFRIINRTVENSFGGRPAIEYALSPLAFEFMVARKNKDVFSVYHAVFHHRTGKTETPAFDKAAFKDCMMFMAEAKKFAVDTIGLVDSQALLSANQVTFKATGVDVLEYFHQKCIPANPKGLTYNPTELGELLNPVKSARFVNKELARAGLQVNINGKWEPTDKAKLAGVFEWTDTGKRHHDGVPVKQLRWFKDALDHVVQDRREAA